MDMLTGHVWRNPQKQWSLSCCWGMLHSIRNASRSMLVTCLLGSFQSWFVSPQCIHMTYDIDLVIYVYIYIHIYIYIHNINLCICTNMRNCLKHAQNMSHTHARLTNIFMYVSCACMIYIYIYTYIYIYIYIWCIYIYYTVLIYQYIPYASFSHISSLRVATAAGQWESMTATPRDLRQNMVSFSANQRVNPTSRRRMSWIEFSAFEYIYIYIYNFIHTYVCVHMSLCVRVRVEIGGTQRKTYGCL